MTKKVLYTDFQCILGFTNIDGECLHTESTTVYAAWLMFTSGIPSMSLVFVAVHSYI